MIQIGTDDRVGLDGRESEPMLAHVVLWTRVASEEISLMNSRSEKLI
jgi:hypothetical protein